MAVSVVAIGVAVTPLLIVSWHQAKTGWLPVPHVQDLVRRIFASGSRYSLPMLLIGAFALLSLALLALSRLSGFLYQRRRVPGEREGNRSALNGVLYGAPLLVGLACWVVVPVSVSYIASQGPLRLFSSRYLTVVIPALGLFVGLAVAMVRWRWVQIVLALGIVGGSLAALPSHYAHAQVEDWRTPTRWLERQYEPGDGLICYNNVQGCQIAVEYYLFADESAAHFSPDSPGAVWLTTYGHGDPFRDFMGALHPAELAPFAAKHPRIFYIAGRLIDAADAARALAAEHWLDQHYQFVAQISSNVATIRLYVTGAPASAP